jgi:hypothetical protein
VNIHCTASVVRLCDCLSTNRNVKLAPLLMHRQAGHSDRARPGPIPNPEVKPVDAAALLTCVSGWKTAVLAFNKTAICPFGKIFTFQSWILDLAFPR